jgi:hypothetical protein
LGNICNAGHPGIIWTAGKKKTRAPRWSSGGFSNRLWQLIFGVKILRLLFENWAPYRDGEIEHSNGDTWDRMLYQGIHLLERFAQDDRVRIRQPRRNLQIKFTKPILGKNDFVAYVDAIGKLNQKCCLLEWKTTSSRYLEEPDGLLALDPQLVC